MHGFWQNDLVHLEAQDSSDSFPWRLQDGRTRRPDPNSCTHTISRPGHDNHSACRQNHKISQGARSVPSDLNVTRRQAPVIGQHPQVTRCMSKYYSSLENPKQATWSGPQSKISWLLYTWSYNIILYMISIYTVQSLQDSLEEIPNLWSHPGLMKALGLQLVNSWHGSRWLIWSWTVCGELWFQNTLRCHQTWQGNPQQDVHFPSFSSKPCLIPVGPP